ncbi:MAG: N-acetylmuramoyl-L-alanine amidase [Lachnospiraceae bacterium]|nr:N-acetylmuramoyl-L-alanine amidase [Lachnospiraceae bacterium]
MPTVVIDAGHGGSDFGATYMGRREKDDSLNLALAVGNILKNNGINVIYTRTNDVYEAPASKARDANAANADYFISIHRNSSPYSNQYTGIESLVYNRNSIAGRIAENINRNLTGVGFANQGIQERTNLAVLRRTNMPAVLVEVGFINTDRDNARFDSRFNEIAEAIADGILDSI